MAFNGTVLVTGHLGYLGAQVARVARSTGRCVRGVDAALYAAEGGGALALVPRRAVDIRDLEREDLAGVSAVIHLAGLSSDPLSALVPETTLDVNYRATVRLAELARDAGVGRFVFASTLGVFGNTEDAWCEEDTPLSPTTVYRESKARAETELRALATPDFRPLVLRLPTLFGDSPNFRRDLVVNLFVDRALRGLPLEIDGGGQQWRPLLHVYDAARCFVAALSVPPEVVNGGVVNLCESPQNLRIAQVAEQVAEAFPDLELHWRSGPPPAPGSYRARSHVLGRWLPNFRPRFDIRSGIRELEERLRHRPLSSEEREVGVRVAWVRSSLERGRLDERLRPTDGRRATGT